MPNSTIDYRAHPEGVRDVWVDWSGISAVAICPECRWTFLGFAPDEAQHKAMRHRVDHEDMAGLYKQRHPFVKRHPCTWGETIWGRGKGEVCTNKVISHELCANHLNRWGMYEKRGTCAWPETCWEYALETQPICRAHGYIWAKEQGIKSTAVFQGKVTYVE